MLAFFLGIITFLANPLERLSFTPPDGQGINPLLVHFGMFIHPPMQMAGLISVALPFSIAMGALLAGRGGRDEWVDFGRTWGMISWLILTIGLLLGSWWAYTILGWGGYWAWDPVENSALMPWLAMTAFVHSIMVQKRRGMFRMWNIVLVAVAFTLAEMGMFINRGGPVPSVHSFAQSAMGWLFLAFMGFTLLGSLAAFAWRMNTLRSREALDSMLSRGERLPDPERPVPGGGLRDPVGHRLSRLYPGGPGRHDHRRPAVLRPRERPPAPGHRPAHGGGPSPAVEAGVVAKRVLKAIRVPLVVAAATMAVVALAGVHRPVALVAIGVVALAVAGIAHEWVRGAMSRHRKGESYPVAFARLLGGNRPRYGGYVVHLAISMLAVGAIASSFYEVQRDFVMEPGDAETLGGYTFEYLGFGRSDHPDRSEVIARFAASAGGSDLGAMEAKRSFYHDFRMSSTRAAIRSTPLEDFYIVPSEFEENGRAVFRVYVNPLVWWMWASGPLFVLGTVLALSPRRERAAAALRIPAAARLARA